MAIDITIPSPGESITEVTVGAWHKSGGDWVEKDELVVEIESDKVTLEVHAPEAGLLDIQAPEGAEKQVGDVIGSIDPDAKRPDGARREGAKAGKPAEPEKAEAGAGAPKQAAAQAQRAPAAQAQAAPAAQVEPAEPAEPAPRGDGERRATPVARKVAAEKGVDLAGVSGSGPSGRIMKSDVLAALQKAPASAPGPALAPMLDGAGAGDERPVRRERMSRLRQRIAERLVAAQRTAAMLTTFNEVDMNAVLALRKAHKERFEEVHGVGLGFMSFFVTACASALKKFPRLNAYVVDDEIEYHDYVDVSIAVGTEKGLVVPVVRNADELSFADIEKTIAELAARARDGRLSIDEMTGGTFTISNGGVYGSLLSTPILNPPQSGILGMHRIINRPMEDPAGPGQVALRPMMYLALSYDHRIVDGEQAVKFLVAVKEALEAPERMLLGV